MHGTLVLFYLLTLSNLFPKALTTEFQDTWSGLIVSSAFYAQTLPPPPSPSKSAVENRKELEPYTCEKQKLDPETWKKLKINEYLKNYPKGDKLSLRAFAAENSAENFICGLEETCNAGQLCAPVVGRAWYVLFAAQQFNEYQMSLYNAIGIVGTMAQSAGAELVLQLFEPKLKKKATLLHKVSQLLTLCGAIVSVLLLAPLLFVPGLDAFVAVAIVSAAYATVQVGSVMASGQAQERAEKENAFMNWAIYSKIIADWKDKFQMSIGNEINSRIKKGVSDDNGIYGIISTAAFSSNELRTDTHDLEKKYRPILIIRLISQMLRAQKAFVTRGSDPCNKKGFNGAFPLENGWLSYCDENKMMFNIIRAEGSKSHNHLYNAKAIVQNYGLSVEYLTQQAYRCKLANIDGQFDHDPFEKGQKLRDSDTPCLFNLPVCDCTIPEVSKHRKQAGTVGACRQAGQIPI
ncbi:hypothetical protein BY996DRAFT_6816569 [Phakopsora pachyrhizi]|nr:hypothetical protein BY996DRAFT_6816569 [Phakopsora pachyrhizi]